MLYNKQTQPNTLNLERVSLNNAVPQIYGEGYLCHVVSGGEYRGILRHIAKANHAANANKGGTRVVCRGRGAHVCGGFGKT